MYNLFLFVVYIVILYVYSEIFPFTYYVYRLLRNSNSIFLLRFFKFYNENFKVYNKFHKKVSLMATLKQVKNFESIFMLILRST